MKEHFRGPSSCFHEDLLEQEMKGALDYVYLLNEYNVKTAPSTLYPWINSSVACNSLERAYSKYSHTLRVLFLQRINT